MVKLYKEGEGVNEFDAYMFSNEADILDANETEGLVPYNVVRDMVNRYISAVRLFDETMAAAEKINSIACFMAKKPFPACKICSCRWFKCGGTCKSSTI